MELKAEVISQNIEPKEKGFNIRRKKTKVENKAFFLNEAFIDSTKRKKKVYKKGKGNVIKEHDFAQLWTILCIIIIM